LVREHARPTEANAFDNLAKTAQRAIDNNSGDFEAHLDDLRSKNFMILWRQDWFVIDRFKWLSKDSYLFPDAREHAQLSNMGQRLSRPMTSTSCELSWHRWIPYALDPVVTMK
jgi:molecular chaperone DnaK